MRMNVILLIYYITDAFIHHSEFVEEKYRIICFRNMLITPSLSLLSQTDITIRELSSGTCFGATTLTAHCQ